MSSSAEKQPKKKRRIEDERAQPGPSSAVQALTSPHLVRKSSRDPNQGLYPRTRSKSKQEASHLGFETAASLYKHSSHKSPSVKEKANAPQAGSSKSVDSCDHENSVETVPKPSSSYSVHPKIRKRSKYALQADFPPEAGTSNSVDSCENSVETAPKPSSNYSVRPKTGKRSKFALQAEKCKKITQFYQVTSYRRKEVFFKDSTLEAPKEWSEKNEELIEYLEFNQRFFDTFNKCYGLVELPPSESPDYINQLPNHVLEYIFCQIPYKDMNTCREVCHRWKDVIDDESFMKWKKLYYRLKFESATTNRTTQEEIFSIAKDYGYSGIDTGIETIVRFMAKGFHQRPSNDMFTLLIETTKGKLADEVMTERFSAFENKESRVWCQLAIAIIISESVWEILRMYNVLFNSISESSRPAVLDAMYCIATFLLFFRNVGHTNYAFHYRLYYVLNMLDNYIPLQYREKLKIVKGLPGQQNIHSYSSEDDSFSHLTIEQIRILNHRFHVNQRIRIIALAGSGKTTTLRNLAKLYPQIKFLNIVFNKALSEEAKKSFPPNVTCLTAHSLAYASVGKYLRHKLVPKIRAFDVGAENTKHNTEGCPHFTYANLVLVALNNFVTSLALEISMHHIPFRDASNQVVSHKTRENVLKDVRELWARMINKDNPTKITHDVYLKLYQLRRPSFKKYQCILVDEAQDCNPAMLDIVLSQPIPVVVVGDPHQQIYSFRGAVNGLTKLNYTHTYYLTKSFRFGPEISYIASSLLECYKTSSRDFTLVGSEKESFIDGKVCGQYAVIARTNVKLFNEAVRLVIHQSRKPHEPVVGSAAFIGGIRNYGFEQMIDIYKLRGDLDELHKSARSKDERISRIKDRFIARFHDLKELTKYAMQAGDTELQTKIDLVNQHGSNIFNLVSILIEKCSHPVEEANVVFTTAHKAKGLEFDTVSLTDDFPFSLNHLDHFASNTEDLNVMYVALTRAKKSLILPEKIMKILMMAHEKFEFPISSKKLLGNEKKLICCSCQSEFAPHTVLLMFMKRMLVASGREISGGPLCMKCGTDPYMRPEVHVNNIVMLLDVVRDNCHEFLKRITGPLPGEPEIKYQSYNYGDEADIFVINIHN